MSVSDSCFAVTVCFFSASTPGKSFTPTLLPTSCKAFWRASFLSSMGAPKRLQPFFSQDKSLTMRGSSVSASSSCLLPIWCTGNHQLARVYRDEYFFKSSGFRGQLKKSRSTGPWPGVGRFLKSSGFRPLGGDLLLPL